MHSYYAEYATVYGITIDEFLKEYCDMTVDEFLDDEIFNIENFDIE